MDLENMSLDELKEYAKKNNIKVGNIGKEKLIEKSEMKYLLFVLILTKILPIKLNMRTL